MGASWRGLGSSWTRLGDAWEASWGVLGVFFSVFETSLKRIARKLDFVIDVSCKITILRFCREPPKPSWKPLGDIFETSWKVLVSLGGVLDKKKAESGSGNLDVM